MLVYQRVCFFQLTTPNNIRGHHRSRPRVWRPLGPWSQAQAVRLFGHESPTYPLRYPHRVVQGEISPLLPLLVLDDLIPSCPSWVGNLWSTDMTMKIKHATLKDLSKRRWIDDVCRSFMRSTNTPWDSKTYQKTEDMKKNRRFFSYICLNTCFFIHFMGSIVIFLDTNHGWWAAPLGRCRHARGDSACARRRGGRGRHGRCRRCRRGGAAQQAVFLGTWSPAGWEMLKYIPIMDLSIVFRNR